MNDPFDSLDGTLDRVWRALLQGVADREASARHPVLATAGRDGGAEARVVILRAADRATASLRVHTDARSGKVAELARDARATLLVWDPEPRLQVRLRSDVSARAGTAEEWDAVPDTARRVYGGTPPPGEPVPDPAAHDPKPEPRHFTVLEARIVEIETLHLGDDRHRRALFRRDDGFAGRWIAP